MQPNWPTVAQAVQLMGWCRTGPATRSQSERSSAGVDGEIRALASTIRRQLGVERLGANGAGNDASLIWFAAYPVMMRRMALAFQGSFLCSRQDQSCGSL